MINYDYNAISDACQALLQITQQMENSVNDLVHQVEQNKGEYLVGTTADAYGAQAQQISKQFEEDIQTLSTAAQKIMAGGEAMQETDRRLAGNF